MRWICTVCAVGFDAKRESKYCGGRCRKRAQRRPEGIAAAAIPAGDAPDTPGARPGAGLEQATRGELAAAGRAETAVGQAAVVLAHRIDRGTTETGASLAAMVREYRATLAEALRETEQSTDPLDELRARRERGGHKLAG